MRVDRDALTVLVTGCRSGFGLRAAVAAARRGHTVYAGLRDLATADALRAAAEGLPVYPVQLDVTDPAQRRAVVDAILQHHGHIDALVNNAGVVLGGQHEILTEDELRGVFEVNVFAAWALTRLVLPGMRARGGGAIVNLSSTAGRIGWPGLGAYAGSKFALEGLSETLHHEVAPFGVRVHLVEPGVYRTDMLGRNRRIARRATAPDNPYAAYDARARALFERRVAPRARDPQVVADKIVSLIERPTRRLRHPLGARARLRLAFVRYAPFALWAWLLGRRAAPRPAPPRSPR